MFAQQIDQGKGVDNERMDKQLAIKGMLGKEGEELKDEQIYIT
jgi:hypothetical protein